MSRRARSGDTRGGDTRSDDGQVALLVLVYTLISLSFVAVAVDATAVHLARTQLLDAADAAASMPPARWTRARYMPLASPTTCR